MKTVLYPEKITVGGVTYVHGPALPATEDKCAHCAAIGNDALCEAMGWECLRADPIYWVASATPVTETRADKRMVACDHCGKRRLSASSVKVRVSGTAVETWCAACFTKDGTICQTCGTKVSAAYAGDVDGDTFCNACRDTKAFKCDRCGKWETRRNEPPNVWVGGAVKHWCTTCRSERSSVCGHCGKRVASDEVCTVDNSTWCNPCADEFAFLCENCGNLSANLEYNEDSDQYRCAACTVRSAPSANLVYDYHGFMRCHTLKFWGGNKADAGTLFMGFELEAGGTTSSKRYAAAAAIRALDTTEEHVHMEHDGSIPDAGFETISAPHTLAAHEAYGWDRICKILVDNSFKSHDTGGRCGLHVHVSRAFLTADDCAKLDLITLKNKLFWERVARRSEVSYAAFIKKDKLTDYGKSGNRYAAINFQPERTVEFRLFRGTLKYDTLMATLQIVDGICRWVKTRTIDQLHKNEGELEKFVAFLEQDKATYGRAIAYIERRKAVVDPNAREAGAETPDI